MAYFDRDARLNAALKGLGSQEAGTSSDMPAEGSNRVGPDGKVSYRPKSDPYAYKYDPQTAVFEVYDGSGELVMTAAPGSPTYDQFLQHMDAHIKSDFPTDVPEQEPRSETDAMGDAISGVDRAYSEAVPEGETAAKMASAREGGRLGTSQDAPIPEVDLTSSTMPEEDETSEDVPASMNSLSGMNLMSAARKGMRRAAQKRNARNAPIPGVDTP